MLMENKDISIVILGVVSVIAVVALVLLFKTAFSGGAVHGAGIYAQVRGDLYGGGFPVYSDNCETLYGKGYIFTQGPRNFDWTCKPGLRTETWKWRAPGLDPWFNNPQYYETEGYCCPIGAGFQ
jgi:hypothetical protein